MRSPPVNRLYGLCGAPYRTSAREWRRTVAGLVPVVAAGVAGEMVLGAAGGRIDGLTAGLVALAVLATALVRAFPNRLTGFQ